MTTSRATIPALTEEMRDDQLSTDTSPSGGGDSPKVGLADNTQAGSAMASEPLIDQETAATAAVFDKEILRDLMRVTPATLAMLEGLGLASQYVYTVKFLQSPKDEMHGRKREILDTLRWGIEFNQFTLGDATMQEQIGSLHSIALENHLRHLARMQRDPPTLFKRKRGASGGGK